MPNSGWFIRLAPRVVRSAVRRRCSAAADISPRALLLSSVLLMSALSAAICFVLAQYFSVDTFSSLVYLPDDCWLDWGMNVGRHCFSDYAMPVTVGALPNPWKPYPLFMYPDYRPFMNNYPAAGMVPQMTFALLGKGLGAPRIGLFGYLLVLAIAVVSPAWWAARGARGLDRIVVFVACGVAAVPAWTTVDRGNSVGFFVPIALVCLVALRRQRWGLVAIMVVLAALIKPQFGILAVALLAARKWRLGGITIGGGLICNLGAYALWPADFPATVMQSVHNTLGYGSPSSSMGLLNVSFAKGLLAIPDGIEGLRSGGTLPNGFLAGPRSVLGYAILVLVVGSILLLGRRIPPVVVGIALLAAVSLFPAVTNSYYLVFVLPVAAVLIRDPSGASGCGIFDRLEPLATPRRTVGICVSLATALSIAQVAAPCAPFQMLTLGPGGAVVGTTAVVRTSVVLAPIFWLIACAVIIISFARRPAVGDQVDIVTASMPAESTLAAAGHPRPSGLDLGPPQAAATSNPT
ncbi:hypothetical protein A5696_09125 [Mycobacterium sp. E2699]|nr:hypothetical protein A5696_09125 [Mycobacterium sp. E2699]